MAKDENYDYLFAYNLESNSGIIGKFNISIHDADELVGNEISNFNFDNPARLNHLRRGCMFCRSNCT